MKVNFDHVLVSEDGKPVYLSGSDGKNPLTAKEACVKALLYPPTSKNPPLKEKRMRYDTAALIQNFGSNAELNEEQANLIRECIGDMYVPVVVGALCELLDGKTPTVFSK